ncbi:MAG: hypothetical protein MHM6MM_004261 [Cercozoa sp. M6MM]
MAWLLSFIVRVRTVNCSTRRLLNSRYMVSRDTMGERSPTSSLRVVDTSDKSVDIRVVFACSHFFVVVLERDGRRVTFTDSLSQVMRGAWEAVLEVHAAPLLDGGHTEWTFRCVVVEVQSTNECLLRAFSTAATVEACDFVNTHQRGAESKYPGLTPVQAAWALTGLGHRAPELDLASALRSFLNGHEFDACNVAQACWKRHQASQKKTSGDEASEHDTCSDSDIDDEGDVDASDVADSSDAEFVQDPELRI